MRSRSARARAALLCVAVLCLGLWLPGHAEPVERPRPRAAVIAAVDTLRRWDDRRAAAYARGDVGALRRLYVPGSTAADRDARLLRSYLRRGLVVHGLRMQLLEVRLLSRNGSLVRLRVEDRVVGASVEPGPGPDLPADLPTTRVVTLVRDHGERWRMWAVRAVSAGPPPAAR